MINLRKKKNKARGLNIAATKSSVVLYNTTGVITITPELAERLAVLLPRYAAMSRSLSVREQ